MVACDEVMRGQTAEFAGFRRGAFFNRLSPVVWALSPTVTVCQDLPRLVSFSDEGRRPSCRRENVARCSCRSMLLAGSRLWHVGISGRTEMRSVASHLSLEKEGEEPSGPVTVCHVDNEALKRETSGQAFRRGPRPALNWPNGVNGVERWSKDDSLQTEAVGKATFGDTRRQILRLRIRAGGGVFPGGRVPAFSGYVSKSESGTRLMVNVRRSATNVSHVCGLMQSGVSGRKPLVRHDKKRQMQNSQFTGHIGREIPAGAWIRDGPRSVGNPRLQFEPTIVSGIYSRQLRSSGTPGISTL